MAAEPLEVSPNYRWHESDRTIEDVRAPDEQRRSDSCFAAKVDVFEDRVRGWFLDIAKGLIDAKPSPGDYVAVSILLGYVEAIEQFRRGEHTPDKKSTEWFTDGMLRVLTTENIGLVAALWKRGRNGLFHDSFTKDKTVLSRQSTEPATLVSDVLQINPAALASKVTADFSAYVRDLRGDPSGGLAGKFVKLWTERWDES